MTTRRTPRVGLRQILGFEPFPSSPVSELFASRRLKIETADGQLRQSHYVKRKSTRKPSGLLPKNEYASVPFGSLLYGKDAVVLTPKKKAEGEGGGKVEEKKDEAKAEEKKNEAKAEEKKDGNGDEKKNGNGNGKKKDNGNGKEEKKNGNGDHKEDGNVKAEEQKADKAADDKAAAKDPAEFTKEEDEELMKLKNENTAWAAISASMGKPIQALKQRFGQIKPKDWRPGKQEKNTGGDTAKPEEKKAEEIAKPDEKKEEPKTEVKQDGNGKGNGKGNAKGNGKGNGKNGGKESEKKREAPMGDDMTSVYEFEGQTYKKKGVDERFPADMLHFAGHFDDRWYWLNMASRIFDKFGTRYTPEELKAKMTGQN